jgi:hypothetical protein
MRAKIDVVLFLACAFLARPDATPAKADGRRPTDASLLIDDPPTLKNLELQGYSLDEVLGPGKKSALLATVTSDMQEFTKGLPPKSIKRPFKPEWMTRGRFELTAVVNRLDRREFDPPEARTCGEVRLVYRLALKNPGRPSTRLPMTVNVRIPQPLRGADCRPVAERWRSGHALVPILRELPPVAKVEINFQSLHIPSIQMEMDDNAEYVQRTFRVENDTLVPETLFNTPRADLSVEERSELVRWIDANLAAIDAGTAVVPEKFLALRSVSISPRGLVHARNRPFSSLLDEPARATLTAHLASAGPLPGVGRPRALVTTTDLLLRRLDESTCPGCHQSRGIAGFHLLGEERDPEVSFNALAVGHSPHLSAELPWRADYLAKIAAGATTSGPRPFSAHPEGPGRYGAACGVASGMAAWTCAPGLECRDFHGSAVGVCAPPTGTRPGDPCELVQSTPSTRPEGAFVTSKGADKTCPLVVGTQDTGAFCAPNWLGFTGGMCSERCSTLGEIGDGAICAPLPSSGYEAECFTKRVPVEECLKRHFVSARIATCDATRPCRDDYACARVPGAPPSSGACIPPYFVFQLRVDGPLLDR